MFWKKKEIKEQKWENEPEVDNSFLVCDIPILKRKTRHAKTIIDNKLYDTEKAELISPTANNRILFVTKKGNYFSCDTSDYHYTECEEDKIFNVSETVYHNIRPEPLEYAMSNIGKYQPEKYIELFGEVEEA